MKRLSLFLAVVLAATTAWAEKPAIRFQIATDGTAGLKPDLAAGTPYAWAEASKTDTGCRVLLLWVEGGRPAWAWYDLPFAVDGMPGPAPEPGPLPPEPKPQPEPPVPVGVIHATVFERPNERQPWQQAVDDYLEDALQSGDVSRYRRYAEADAKNPKSTDSVRSYAKIIEKLPMPCIVIIGLPTEKDTAGRVLYAGELPKTVDEAKKLLSKYGAAK